MEVPTYLHPHIGELIHTEQSAAIARSYWVVVLGLQPKRDGNQWCFLWGENLHEGVVAFGDTPLMAMVAFDAAMCEKISKETP